MSGNGSRCRSGIHELPYHATNNQRRPVSQLDRPARERGKKIEERPHWNLVHCSNVQYSNALKIFAL